MNLTSFIPLGIDHPPPGKWITDILFEKIPVDANFQSIATAILLLGFFAIPHSTFARVPVKAILGEASSGEISAYRSIFVLQATIALSLIMHCWQPIYPD